VRSTRLVVIVLAGCSSFGSTPDNAVVDAGADTGAAADAEAGTTASGNLLKNGDFELGCADWGGNTASLQDDTIAHGGAKSCRACQNGGSSWEVLQATAPVKVGATYVGEAWVRAAPGVPAAQGIEAHIITYDDQDRSVDNTSTSGAALTADWQHLSVTFTVDKPAARIAFAIDAANAPGCVIVDDASLVVAP
jgi:hypothetical protein